MPFRIRLFLLVYGNIKIAKNRLQVTQNEIIRFVLKMNQSSHYVGANKVKYIGWLPISCRVDQIILNYVFKIKSRQSAHYIAANFIQARSVHSYGTRFRKRGNFSIPKVKSLARNHLFTIDSSCGMTCLVILKKNKAFMILK